MMPNNCKAFEAGRLDRLEPVGILLKSLQHSLRQSMEEALRKRGIELSFAHFAALFGLYSEPGLTGAQLARRIQVSAQTMNTVLHRLEDDGRIERRPHPDNRRADCWTLTAAGVELLAAAREVGAAVFSRMLAPLAAAELVAFEDYLRRCVHALEGRVAEPPGAAASAAASEARGADDSAPRAV